MSRQPEGCDRNYGTRKKTTSTKKKLQKLFKSFKVKERSKSSDDTITDQLKFVCISDTHSDPATIPDGDVLLHAGDFTMGGTLREVKLFNDFLGSLPHRWKIVIAGNHDMIMQSKENTNPKYWKRLKQHLEQHYGVSECRDLLTNCIYLEDELIDICGIRIYGSPWTNEYRGLNGFQLPGGQDMRDKWEQIPDDVHILMTHGPPYGICDTTRKGVHAGCKELLTAVQTRVKPQIHLFGHIHEGYGEYCDGTTRYINASMSTVNYHTTNRPFIVDINPRSVCDFTTGKKIASISDTETCTACLQTECVRRRQYENQMDSDKDLKHDFATVCS